MHALTHTLPLSFSHSSDRNEIMKFRLRACGPCVDGNVFDGIDHAANGMTVEVFVFQMYMLKALSSSIQASRKKSVNSEEGIYSLFLGCFCCCCCCYFFLPRMSVNWRTIGRHSVKFCTYWATSFVIHTCSIPF